MPQGKPDSFFGKKPFTIVVEDSQGVSGIWEWIQNADDTWTGPLEGQDALTYEEVTAQMKALIDAGDR